MQKITLLGATGSVGLQTLEVIRQQPHEFQLYAMAFGTNTEIAIPIIEEFKPKYIAVKDKETKDYLQTHLSSQPNILSGDEGMSEISTLENVDIVVNAVLGSVGLEPTLHAIRAQKKIAFANKETLVTAGHLVMKEAEKYGVELLPVDSEHAAIHQCLKGERLDEVKRIIITASGGSFRDKTRDELREVTVNQALKHPNWSMGAKITIDSATMMNKGLEVIEAHWLFHMPYEQLDVILHKESIIHSMVEFKDHSLMAQLGTTDMKGPIQYALTYPNRLDISQEKGLNLVDIGKLHFDEMSFERFPCLKMAYDAGRAGGTMPTVLNAANEEAVQQFLNNKISFLAIEDFIQKAMDEHTMVSKPDLTTIVEVDQETRRRVKSYVN
ncbi:1-deoxy-D-xylulose-5-phosphate reductoisomerase [Salinibacillus xinjiangensis]|uniref:1-deoxy-D-xylulose 5-phosphate reductoisomerase n=1 Tax=Salinibacillus xinjiangensis TaxID=1229268 RepID=A0A6G1X386_9BACI|nr:1-deoxy-D-xylulose-5-phosphate reductoisomerase [Salinibacillus xinjiangensis]MRG85365.1 1-deoxy-D-xylulose-5-phosphate reductoisomerase [Salinibacillus xinjiangensis]